MSPLVGQTDYSSCRSVLLYDDVDLNFAPYNCFYHLLVTAYSPRIPSFRLDQMGVEFDSSFRYLLWMW